MKSKSSYKVLQEHGQAVVAHGLIMINDAGIFCRLTVQDAKTLAVLLMTNNPGRLLMYFPEFSDDLC